MILAAILTVASPLAAESVAIRVETQKGKPIEGAVVSVRDSENGTVLDSAVSSDEGVAIIQQLTPGEWYFEIDRSGYMLYTAYVQVRAGKKPELGFASQVSRGDDWEPMRVKFIKASDKLMRKAVIEAPPQPRVREPVRVEPRAEPQPQPPTEPAPTEDTRPEQRPAPEDVTRVDPPEPAAGTVAVPSTVEEVEPETVPAGQETPPELTVADGDPEPLEEASPSEPRTPEAERADPPAPDTPAEDAAEDLPVSDAPEPLAAGTPSEPAQSAAPEAVAEPEPDSNQPLETPTPPTAEPTVEPALEPELEAPTQPQVEPEFVEGGAVEDGATRDEPGVNVESDAPAGETPTPQVETEEPEAVTPTPTRPPAASRSLRSAAGGTCPECAAGEWAVSADVQAATAGDTRSTSTCADDLEERVQTFAEQLAARPQESFAGPLTAALWRTSEDAERLQMAEAAASFNPPQGFCQVAGVLLPSGATMTGYVLEAWDELGGRACNAEGICALGKAAWDGEPVIVSGDHATVVYAVFRNRSTRHERSAELTVLFTPPPEWQ